MDEPMVLTELERLAILGTQAREREVARAGEEVRADWRAALGAIEGRLGLSAGALGPTHDVRADTWAVAERADAATLLPDADAPTDGGVG